MAYLQHFGIKGMKWGIRKDSKKTIALKKQLKRTMNRQKRADLKAQIKDSQTQDHIDRFGLSHRQKNLKQKFIELGYSKKNAEIAAVKKDQKQKKMMVFGSLALTAAVAYGAYKKYQYNVDTIIPKDQILGRIARDSNKTNHEGAYFYTNKHDAKKYNGLWVNQLNNAMTPDIFRKQMKANENLKIASPKTYNKIVNKLYDTDSAFKKEMDSTINLYGKNYKRMNKRGEQINSLFVYGNGSDSYNKINKELKKRGYSGFIDINDVKYSGYNSRKPVVLIQPKKVNVLKVEKITNQDIADAKRYTNWDLTKKTGMLLGKQIAIGVSVGKTVGAYKKNKIVNRYYKQHPNSDKTPYEIYRDYEKEMMQKYEQSYRSI